MENIYTKFGKKDSIQEFIFNLFSIRTCYDFYAVETFKDKECKILQCHGDKFRSIDDVFNIINTYYNINYGELLHYLLTTKIKYKDKLKSPYFLYCEDTNLFTMCFSFIKKYNHLYNDYEEYPDHSSTMSWYELFLELDIKTQENLDNYLEKHKNEIKIFDYETL